jgi:hypothetical protein
MKGVTSPSRRIGRTSGPGQMKRLICVTMIQHRSASSPRCALIRAGTSKPSAAPRRQHADHLPAKISEL